MDYAFCYNIENYTCVEMQYSGESILFRGRDAFGELVVTEGALVRTLYFGNEKRQSAMFLQHAGLLVLEYTQVMMLSLIFNRQPHRVFCLGLGGGSIPKFLLRACHVSQVDVVELRQAVIQVAYRFFDVPENSSRLNIECADGASYFDGVAQHKSYDLMFIDGFDRDGPVDAVSNIPYLAKCASHLSANGILCINLWNRRKDDFQQRLKEIRALFDGGVLLYQLGKLNSNVVLFCFRNRSQALQIKRYEHASRQLQREFGINFRKYFSRLYKQNVPMYQRLMRA